MAELLDTEPLEGPMGVARALIAPRHAVAVPTGEPEVGIQAIRGRCQLWAGASHLLVPVDGGVAVGEEWARLIDEADLDRIEGNWSGPAEPTGLGPPHPLLAILASRNRPRDQLRRVGVARVADDDPWWMGYAGVLGDWPDEPSSDIIQQFPIRSDVGFDEIIPTDFVDVSDPSANDLLTRLRDPLTVSPAALTSVQLMVPAAGQRGISGRDGVLPQPNEIAEAIGPNIVVVYEPGSVEDLCLLWDLRAANGLRPGLPLAVPVTANVADILSGWTAGGLWTYGLSETLGAVVSYSVSARQLATIVRQVGEPWRVVAPADVLRAADAPHRTSRDVAVFDSGWAAVSAWSPSDRDLFQIPTSHFPDFGLGLRMWPVGRPAPRIAALKGSTHVPPTYRGGGIEFRSADPSGIVEVRWPTGWTVLEAAARDRGLKIAPSGPGAIAAAVLRRLETRADLEMLKSPEVLELLYRLGEQSGMSWLRARWREVTRAGPDISAIESELRRIAAMPVDDDLHDLGWGEFVKSVGSQPAAEAWLGWAEDRGLLIRGARAKCNRCGNRAWRGVGELAPPMVCHGCGMTIAKPYDPRPLPWSWRASRLLVQAAFHDVLPHLLACSWLADLLSGGAQPSQELYGFYPGVVLSERDGKEIGEADAVLLFAGGDMVVGECKRSGAGLNDHELEKLDRLAERVGAPWTFVATPAFAAGCPPSWPNATRDLPNSPRFALTGDHLFGLPTWPIGTNALAWRRETEDGASFSRSPFHERVVAVAQRLSGSGPGWDDAITRQWRL